MPVGISTTNVANPILDWLRGVAPATVPALYAKLHTGDPGAAGTANASAMTTRILITMTAASGGQITLNTVGGSWTMPGTETITHLSVHDAVTGGNFRWSLVLANARSVFAGDTLTLTSLVLGNTPLAS